MLGLVPYGDFRDLGKFADLTRLKFVKFKY